MEVIHGFSKDFLKISAAIPGGIYKGTPKSFCKEISPGAISSEVYYRISGNPWKTF